MAKDRLGRGPKRAPGARLPRLGPIFYNEKFQPLLGGRSTVGQRTLTPLIGVRIPASQPNFFEKKYLRPTSFLRKSLPLNALSSARTATYAGDRFAVSTMSPYSGRLSEIVVKRVPRRQGERASWSPELVPNHADAGTAQVCGLCSQRRLCAFDNRESVPTSVRRRIATSPQAAGVHRPRMAARPR